MTTVASSFNLDFRSIHGAAAGIEVAYVPWDSDLFAFPFYQLRCQEPDQIENSRGPLASWLSKAAESRPCLVFTKIPARAAALSASLSKLGFYTVETMLDLYLPFNRFRFLSTQIPANLQLREARAEDILDVVRIARGSFRADRFHLDPHLSSERADERYAQWAERGFRAGDPVFVYTDRRTDQVLAFSHVRETSPKTIDLSLAGIDPVLRHAGIGVTFFDALLTELQSRGYHTATTWTPVNNVEMLSILLRQGFGFRHPVATLHWYGEPGETLDALS